MRLNYYILRDVIDSLPIIEQVEISLDDLRKAEYNIEILKKNCRCCFLDVKLENPNLDIHNLPQDILDLTELLDISLDTFEEIIEDSRPRLDDYVDYLFILFKTIGKHPTVKEGKREFQCGIVIDENAVISIHSGLPIELDTLFRIFNRNPDKLISGTITHLTSCYIDALIDPAFKVIDSWRYSGDSIEWAILQQKSFEEDKILNRLVGIRESIFDTMKILQADREVVGKFRSPKMPVFKSDFVAPELDDHIRHLLDELDIIRLTVSDLMNLFFNAEARKTNRQLSRWTFVTSILLLPSLIAGIFGMNNSPFPEISFGAVLGIMGVSMGVLWLIFKKYKLI